MSKSSIMKRIYLQLLFVLSLMLSVQSVRAEPETPPPEEYPRVPGVDFPMKEDARSPLQGGVPKVTDQKEAAPTDDPTRDGIDPRQADRDADARLEDARRRAAGGSGKAAQ